jgi:hypothetical protein
MEDSKVASQREELQRVISGHQSFLSLGTSLSLNTLMDIRLFDPVTESACVVEKQKPRAICTYEPLFQLYDVFVSSVDVGVLKL